MIDNIDLGLFVKGTAVFFERLAAIGQSFRYKGKPVGSMTVKIIDIKRPSLATILASSLSPALERLFFSATHPLARAQ